MKSLAIVASHPVQYQAPWYRALATMTNLTVFFGHRMEPGDHARAGFGVPFEWDVPVLEGYHHEWLTNRSSHPDVERFRGCDTPEIAERLGGGRYDAVVVNGWNLLCYWQAVRAARRQDMLVLVRGDSQLATERGRLRLAVKRLAYPRLLRAFDAFLTVGRRSEDYYRYYGVSRRRLFRSPHCVDNDFFSAASRALRATDAGLRRERGLASEEVVFAFVGKLTAIKRPLDFLAALTRARRNHPGIRGLMVGDGPMRNEVETYLRSHDTGCVAVGFLNQSEIAGAYVAADALVLPSNDTWGLVVNEAMACGTPAIVSDAAGCGPDLIDEGRTGFIYPRGNADALAERMIRFASLPPAARQAMGRQAAERVAGYSPTVAAAGVLDALSALSRDRRTGPTLDSNHVNAIS